MTERAILTAPLPSAPHGTFPLSVVVGTGEGANSRCVRVWCVQGGDPRAASLGTGEGGFRARRPVSVEPSGGGVNRALRGP
jgi:hypothetical protein